MLSHAVAKKPFNMAHWFFIVVLLALTPLAVNAHQLTGTVYLGGDPLPGTELTVYDNNRNALQSVNTNEAGSYAVDLPDGTYDLVITPPFELGLSDTLIDDIVIAEQDVVFHFVLLRPEIVLSGVVSAADGTPLSGVELAVYNQQSGENAGYLTTDESGAYSFPVAEGTYNIVAFGYGRNSNIALPDYWKIDPLVNSLVLHEDQIMNLNLPDVRLTGRVNSVNGSGVPDVTLSIRESWQDAGSNYLVQYSNNSLKTDNNGQYSLTVFDRAQYDVSLYPPVDSGFANTVVENNPVEGDTEIDFVLNDAIYLSGKVLTPSNIPVSQVELMVFNIETQHFVGRYTTSEDGEYIFPLRPGLYKIGANGYGQYSNIRLPRRWSISPLADQIPLASDRRFDLVLPVVQLSGVITNENDEPQPNVAAEINQRWNAGDVAYAISIDQNHVLSNSQGQFNFYTFIYTDYSLNLIPQDSRQYATTQYTGLALSQDTVRNFSLSGASRLTGIVTTPGGQPVDGVMLTAIDQTTNLKIASVMTLVDGRYEFHLAPGVYKINAQGYAKDSTQPMPQIWGIQPVLKDLIINGIHEHNIELPLVKITGRIFDSAGTAVAAVQLEVKNAWYDTDGVLYSVNNSGGFVTSDADGYYTVMVLSHDDYQIQLTPPEDAVLLTELINGIDASVNGVHDLVFSPALALEGVVKDDRGNLVSGVNLEFVSRESRRTINRASTDQKGYYRAVLREGNYDITITDSDSPSSLPLPNQFYMAPIVSNYALQNDSTLDLQLPLVNLSGKALDSNGVPVANVQLFINERWKHAGTTFSVFAYGDKFKTDAQGEYRIALFPYANYSQQIIPPKASGFTTATIDNFSLERDSLQDIILSLPDTKPPVIVAGPYVTQITDISAVVQWQTDEATLGRTVYGTGDLLGQEANDPVYHRTHTMQLNELVPQTTYSLRVFSDDYNHNGAVNSDVVTFTTLALPDTQFPLILEGPSIN
ncbi:MAG: carboxypeptidase-like regulatory domain-containing protein, partial [Gammaproteobacteria bacterium]|nr:carboxypeptidase-like regulatory domain-containing protein [Gammaproteobacteria bacterium]